MLFFSPPWCVSSVWVCLALVYFSYITFTVHTIEVLHLLPRVAYQLIPPHLPVDAFLFFLVHSGAAGVTAVAIREWWLHLDCEL